MATSIVFKSYAKLNLYLDVLDRRDDGYHNIETVFQCVNLADEIMFTEDTSRLSVMCNIPELDMAESNLVYRAAMLLREKTGCSLGAEIRLDKRIPLAAGLAGGSGNGAAALTALNNLWGLRLAPSALLDLALELGSDVPYCMLGGTVAATSRGERMETLAPLPETWFVLLHPPVAVSASRVYNSPLLEHSPETPRDGRTPRFSQALEKLSRGEIAGAVFNRMESAVFATHSFLAEGKQWLLDHGCIAAAMSGSGPTLFGICENRRQATAIADAFTAYPVSVACSVNTGLERTQ